MNRHPHLKAIILLSLLVVFSYANSLQNGFVSDDIDGIARNGALYQAGYIFEDPAAFLIILPRFLIVRACGISPWAFRGFSIFLHLGSVLVAYFLLSRMAGVRAALFAAGLFAVHPLQVEAVAWISASAYVQYSFFLLLALFLYKRSFWGAFILFICGLLSSDKAIVFPLSVLLFIFAFEDIRRDYKRFIPFFAVGCLWAALYLVKIGARITALEKVSYQVPQMMNPLIQIPIAVSSYLGLIFWPKDFTLYHSEMTFTYPGYVLRLAVCVAFLAAVIYSYKKSRFVFFWLSFFIVSLLPVLTPFGVSWIVAERYVYPGALGIFACLGLFFAGLSRVKGLKVALYAVFVLLILYLMSGTVTRNKDWRDEDSLWVATARTSPSSPNTHNNLGDVYSRRGDFPRAAEEFRKAISINPRYAEAYHNLGNTYLNMGRWQEALENYRLASSLNPRLWQSYQNMAAIYFEQGERELAKASLLKALEINPDNADLRLNLDRLGDTSRGHFSPGR